MTRSASKRDVLHAMGARSIIADALDPEDVARAVAEAEPDVIVHQLTALGRSLDMRHFDRDFALTNRRIPTAWPAASRCPAIGAPITPVPTQPTRSLSC